MPTGQMVQRSSGLFFLTSATNVLALTTAGLLLVLGIAADPATRSYEAVHGGWWHATPYLANHART